MERLDMLEQRLQEHKGLGWKWVLEELIGEISKLDSGLDLLHEMDH